MISSLLFEGHLIHSLIFQCRYETASIDEQIAYLNEINRMLPTSERLAIPPLITDDYVTRALDIIEERMFSFKEV